jgi:hypothetical protein
LKGLIIIFTFVSSSLYSQELEFTLANPLETQVIASELNIFEHPFASTKAGIVKRRDSVRVLGWRAWCVYLESTDRTIRGYAELDGVRWDNDSLLQVIINRSPALEVAEIAEARQRIRILHRNTKYARRWGFDVFKSGFTMPPYQFGVPSLK